MNKLQKMLTDNDYLLADGGMGTMLMARGLVQGDPPEQWNVTSADAIQMVHEEYLRAGADIILTNTFGGTRFRLKLHNLQDEAYELNRQGAAIARRAVTAVGKDAVVAGSIGPSGEIMAPVGELSFEDAVVGFAEQARGLADGGADVLWIETMSDLTEVEAAITGCRQATDLPIVTTMTFDTNGNTMMGITPMHAFDALKEQGLTAFGGNCGNGPEEIEGVIQKMYATGQAFPLVSKSNAGIPQYIDGKLLYNGTPEVMAEHAVKVRNFGASIIGACCGSTPEHIRVMREALEKNPTNRAVREMALADAALPTNTRRRRRRRG